MAGKNAKTPLPASGDLDGLLDAILEDDRARAEALVRSDATLVAARVAEARLFDSGILHWLYAGDTALHFAAAGYRVEIVRRLLEAGADPNAAFNHRRSGPLHYAADGYVAGPVWDPERQVATIETLLAAGADLHARDKNGATPLHRAVRTRCAAATRVFLEAGADPIARNLPGSTPFHLAVQNTGRGGSGADVARAAQREIVATFLRFGVDPEVRDAGGKSVREWARNESIRALLDAREG